MPYSYSSSGQKTISKRIIPISLIDNLFQYRISLKGFVMACTSAYGLLLIILFMGFGLISIPKEHDLKSDVYNFYAHTMYRVTLYKKKMIDAKDTLRLLVKNVVLIRRSKIDDNLKEYVQILVDMCPKD